MTANPIEKNPPTLKDLGTYLDLDLTGMLIPAAQVSGVVGGSSANLVTALNVKRDYGAVGDGVADDRVAIQNALNAASSAGQGGVYFPPGIYKIGAALAPKANVAMFGAGPRSSIIKPATNGFPMIDDTVGVSGWSVDRLGFDLSSLTNTFGMRLLAAGCDYVSITNCEFKNIDSGTGATSAGILAYAVTKTRIENCSFLGPANATSVAYSARAIWGVHDWSDFTIRGCTFVGVNWPIYLLQDCRNFLISNNYFQNIGPRGIEIEGCYYGAIVANAFRETTFAANSGAAQLAIAISVTVNGATRSHHIAISDNSFFYTGSFTASAVATFGSHHLTVAGNNCVGAGFEVSYTSDGLTLSEHMLITNNSVTGPGYGTASFFTTNYSRIAGNTFDNCDVIAATIAECHDTTFADNVIRTNSNDGLFIAKAGPSNLGVQDIVVARNYISGCTNGIEVQSDALNTRIRLEFNYLIGNAGALLIGALATHIRRFGNITANADYDANLLTPAAAFALTYGATVNTDASQSTYFTLAITNGTAFTIAAPTNPVNGDTITYDIKNSSGGAHGVITWNAAFLNGGAGTVGTGAFAGIANGKRRLVVFRYDGTNWIEQSRTADV